MRSLFFILVFIINLFVSHAAAENEKFNEKIVNNFSSVQQTKPCTFYLYDDSGKKPVLALASGALLETLAICSFHKNFEDFIKNNEWVNLPVGASLLLGVVLMTYGTTKLALRNVPIMSLTDTGIKTFGRNVMWKEIERIQKKSESGFFSNSKNNFIQVLLNDGNLKKFYNIDKLASKHNKSKQVSFEYMVELMNQFLQDYGTPKYDENTDFTSTTAA